jgi:hypothetical protein
MLRGLLSRCRSSDCHENECHENECHESECHENECHESVLVVVNLLDQSIRLVGEAEEAWSTT